MLLSPKRKYKFVKQLTHVCRANGYFELGPIKTTYAKARASSLAFCQLPDGVGSENIPEVGL